jgi:membrane-bound metal-dependent hydrolase YbcI (DUF457 family)
MYPGHFAAGLALKVAEPKASTVGIMIGVGFLDVVFAVGVGLGVEGGRIGHLNIPWSHSLFMAAVWSICYGLAFWRTGTRISVVMGLAVFSHWLLDLMSHQPDILLAPYSQRTFGFGPMFGGLGGWLEISMSVLGLALYIGWARRAENRERRWPVTALMMTAMYAAEALVVHPFR